MVIGIGIIGTGFGQTVHIPAFQACSGTEVTAVYHRDLIKAKQIAAKFSIPHASDRLGDILSIPEVQAVAISTPPFLHYDIAKAALESGKHVLLEKPITLNLTEAEELDLIAEQQELVVAVDFEFRFVPQWCYLKHLLEQEYIGNIRLISIDWLVPGRADPSRVWNWYSQKSQGGGALGAIGSHAFDYIHWLFGRVKFLCGQLSTSILHRLDSNGTPQPVDADDTCNILMELENGTPCNLALSTVAYGGRGHWVSIYGDRGTLVLGSDNLKDYVHGFNLYHTRPTGETEVMSIPREYELSEIYRDGRIAPLIALCDRFVASIEQNLPMIPSLKEGIYSQLLIDLTQQSHLERKWLNVTKCFN